MAWCHTRWSRAWDVTTGLFSLILGWWQSTWFPPGCSEGDWPLLFPRQWVSPGGKTHESQRGSGEGTEGLWGQWGQELHPGCWYCLKSWKNVQVHPFVLVMLCTLKAEGTARRAVPSALKIERYLGLGVMTSVSLCWSLHQISSSHTELAYSFNFK